MKEITLGVIRFTQKLLKGPGLQREEDTRSQQHSPVRQATTVSELSDSWHAFPTGILLRFDPDGSISHLLGA